MDTHVKEGQLYVQHQKFGKKWKKNWFVLYPASQNGIARLEFFDSHGSGGAGGSSGGTSNEKTRKLDKKIIRLSECISILPALTESCPKDNMAVFCVETNDKTHVFAAEKNTAKEWMDTMCDIAFQGGSGSSSGGVGESDVGSQDLKMSENLIYYSREEVNEFWVGIQWTEASGRCGLAGNYWLKAESNVLVLKEPKTKRNVFVWPYKLLRRYGRDRVMFSFEAGRRCDSGPGNFTFDTKQGNEIFTLVDQAIKSQKALAEERPMSCPIYFDPECPPSLQHIRSAGTTVPGSGDSSSCSSWEADGDSGGSKPGSADGVLGKREGGDGGGGGGGRGQGSGGAERHKGRSLPELPAILGVVSEGNTPPRSPRGQGASKCSSPAHEQAALYSEPADAVRLPLHTADGLYSDPVDSIKGQNASSSTSTPQVPTPRLRTAGDETSGGGVQAEHHHGGNDHKKAPDLYSHVYDHISLELSHKTSMLSLNGSANAGGRGRGGGRGVNSNRRPPGGQAEGAPPAPALEHIYDEPEGCASHRGTVIYDETRLEPPSQKRPEEAAPLTGPEGNYSTPTHGESHKHSPTNRRAQHPPTPRWPKPVTTPKPSRGNFARKEPVPLPFGKNGGPVSNVNNNNNMWGKGGGGDKDLYSKVSKQKASPSKSWLNQPKVPPLRSPDIIYDNLGDI
ncbi:docking protein 1b [Dunckerocampus dactyliophorus]|uniref:docking protein 1b n=1 Tax=Dunckerocampus dactyliophorus TaxID=161453 RepID=UPI0024054375|nr:docking protein 1b [Dunckerocampus dactyliophorus]